MKKFSVLLGVVFLAALLAVPVMSWAYGRGWGEGKGPGYGYCGGPLAGGNTSLTKEQSEQLKAVKQKFYNEVSPIRKNIWDKAAELRQELAKTDPDVAKAKSLQKEISDLQGALAEKRIDHRIEVGKIVPEARTGAGYRPGFRGKGHGPRGFGPMGPGFHGGGYGPGPHWQ